MGARIVGYCYDRPDHLRIVEGVWSLVLEKPLSVEFGELFLGIWKGRMLRSVQTTEA